MKKIVFILFVGFVASAVNADYLLWTVDGATISEYEEAQGVTVTYARFGRVKGDGSWLYDVGSPITSSSTDGEWSGQKVTVGDGLDDDAFAVNVSDMGGADYSYYIELLNSDNQVVGRTVSNDKYIQYSALGNYIATGDLSDIPASAPVWHGGGFEAVPEPSSMALLALGAGLVGLRRKLRKGKKGQRA